MSEDRPEPTGNAVMDAIRIDGVSPDLTALAAIDYVEACFAAITALKEPALLDPTLSPGEVLVIINHLGALAADLLQRQSAATGKPMTVLLDEYRIVLIDVALDEEAGE